VQPPWPTAAAGQKQGMRDLTNPNRAKVFRPWQGERETDETDETDELEARERRMLEIEQEEFGEMYERPYGP
jgi:hypothetical protein